MAEAHTPSLRRRLLALLLGITAAGWLAMAVVGYLDVRHEAQEILDGHLAQTAALLAAQPGGEIDEIDTEHAPPLHRYSLKVAFQVWERGRTLRLHSANAPNVRLSSLEEGFSDVVHEGVEWRVFSAWDAGREILVQVAERQEARNEISAAQAKSLGLWLLAALPALALAIWLAVTHALGPLDELRRELARRDPRRLSPLKAQGVPAETLPLVNEINRLFERIDLLIERERRFTADAAHELRTPLAVLRTQAQVAQSTRADSVRREALDSLIAGTDRATRLIEQMLMLARIESGDGGRESALTQMPLVTADLREIVRSEAAAVAPRAVERHIDLAIEGEGTAPIPCRPELLSILARNLLDNAVRYSPDGGLINVSVQAPDGRAELRISNSGLPIAAEDLARLGERFHRIPGSSESGSGLGLSIVARIAELHHARVAFEHGPGGMGLSVVVSFLPGDAATATNRAGKA